MVLKIVLNIYRNCDFDEIRQLRKSTAEIFNVSNDKNFLNSQFVSYI